MAVQYEKLKEKMESNHTDDNIMNLLGIDRSIFEKTIAEGKRSVSKYYRNRRLGEFLKELDLSEGHSSGIRQSKTNWREMVLHAQNSSQMKIDEL